MLDRSDQSGNRLLAELTSADFGLLAPYLQVVPLQHDAVLLRMGEQIEHVYFPHSGAIAFMVEMPNGDTVATAVVGYEGVVGIRSLLGPTRSSITAIVKVAGTASQISASRFQEAFAQSEQIRRGVESYMGALLAQFQQVAACNALHPVEARLARWLLHIRDRIDGNEIPLTHEALSQLLGVRRTTVTLVLQKLREAGAIRKERRGLIEIDRQRLEDAACECHEVMRRTIDQTQKAVGHRTHATPTREKPGI